MIDFVIKGDPVPLKRHRSTRNGRMYDPSAKDKKQMWLQIAKYKPKTPIKEPVAMKATFVMRRPKSHYRTGKYSHLLKDNVPEFAVGKADLDNLLKMVADVIQGKDRMIYDDNQIVMIFAHKIYGITPQTRIGIETIS